MTAQALRFKPVFREYLWGGRRLETVLNKPIGDGPRYAESWEVVDHGEDQSVVAAGPLAGATLGGLVREQGEWLLGSAAADYDRFPLLLKFLDCQRNLSIQVHPDDARAARLDPPDLGKTEAWYIVDAAAGSRIYAGLKAGVGRADLAAAIDESRILDCLNQLEPQPGDCVFIPAGVVHALGEGLLVAEIQQASDTTYRLDDWGRVGADGKPRALHVEAGLEATDYGHGPVQAAQPRRINELTELLVECDKFVLKRHRFSATPIRLGGDQQFHILTVVEGAAELQLDGQTTPLPLGQSVLIPAASDPGTLSGAATVLEAHLP